MRKEEEKPYFNNNEVRTPKCRVNILEFLKHQHKDKQKTWWI